MLKLNLYYSHIFLIFLWYFLNYNEGIMFMLGYLYNIKSMNLLAGIILWFGYKI